MEKIKCTHCQCEVILREGQRYCKYCGKPLMNKCIKPLCGKALDDDAAFCPYCGHESKFKIKGIVNVPFVEFSSSIESEITLPTELKKLDQSAIHPIDLKTPKKVEAQKPQEEQTQAEVFPVFV